MSLVCHKYSHHLDFVQLQHDKENILRATTIYPRHLPISSELIALTFAKLVLSSVSCAILRNAFSIASHAAQPGALNKTNLQEKSDCSLQVSTLVRKTWYPLLVGG
jgi:hypothetical protein